LVANCEEAQANQDNLQQQLEEMEQQWHIPLIVKDNVVLANQQQLLSFVLF
jgi:hypothetical protein